MKINVAAIPEEALARLVDAMREAKTGLTDENRIAILRQSIDGWGTACPFHRGQIVRPARHSSYWKTSLGLCVVLRVVGEQLHMVDDAPVVAALGMRAAGIRAAACVPCGAARANGTTSVHPAPIP